MKKEFIKNRKGQKMAVVIEEADDPKGLAFIMHGLSGFKEQLHIQVMADAFKEKGYSVVRFDTTNTFGESEGNPDEATITNYLEDLEDVLSWASSQSWYQEPFCLAGHSMGSISISLFAENNSEKVKALAPISTVVSGKLSYELKSKTGEIQEWKKKGYKIEESASRPGLFKKLPWSHMEDRLKYDLLDKVDKLTMPVLLIVGDEDKHTPPEHQKILYDKLPGRKELHIIKGSPHTFREKEHLEEVKQILLKWINTL